MHHRRARPTLRLLKEDLTSGWESSLPQHRLAEGEYRELHPLSELPHPIIVKASESFGVDEAGDIPHRRIESATKLPLLEIRTTQWRGGVWQDDTTGVCWLVVAGLARGNHLDWDDFYQRIKRANQSSDLQKWLPTEEDLRLLNQETAARIRTEWELDIQRQMRDALRSVQAGGACRIEIAHPVPGQRPLASLDLTVTVVREDDYEADEICLDVFPGHKYAGSNLLWQLTMRALISINPPEQGWDRYKDTYSNMGEVGSCVQRVVQLDELVAAGTLAESVPGSMSHYCHRQHLAGQTINGSAARALCGVFFVPTQDHQTLPTCPTCQERLDEVIPQ